VFREPGSPALSRRLDRFDRVLSANLLEAEIRATFAREQLAMPGDLLDAVSWILPDRPLTAELERVLAEGSVRGADCWHLASALFVAPDPTELTFLTLDRPQRATADSLGFRT
jgi:hypothetical protein